MHVLVVRVLLDEGDGLAHGFREAPAGVLSVADGAWLVGERGRAMAEVARHRPGGMAAVMGGGIDEVSALVDTFREEGADLWVANHNSPQQTVIAGSRTAIDAAAARAAESGLRYSVLPVTAACHSPYMEPRARPCAGPWS
ncbi:acyltransferase domain-containing protein [Streptomyces sp. NPDC058067]|uniref:acyltransferase domain-containing protein n=1 Tax=Streptomyces sp. NPDC058067 TaxID=3346324 RepID=UPI0036ECCB17